MASIKFTAVFERHGRWYIGYVPEVPGVHSQERTLAATRKSLVSALRELAAIDPKFVRRSRRIEQLEIQLSS